MSHDDDIFGEIFINPNNTMKATYVLKGIERQEIPVEIQVFAIQESDKKTEICVRALDNSDIETEIDIKYRGNSQVLVEIQPVGHEDILTEIEIRAGNRMWATYEVQRPPELSETLHPIQDSVTREKNELQSINYGGNNSLSVGRTDDDRYRSFVQFDFSNWSPQFKIIESSLRMYYSEPIPKDTKIELFTLDKQWFEYGITHLNRPEKVELITDDYIDYPDKRYVEFELTDIVIDWINNTVNNHGFSIISDSETLVNFRSRESTRPPELNMTYYDTRIYSTGRSHILTELFILQIGDSEILTEIEVGSTISNSFINSEIYVHRYEVPLNLDKESEITVTRNWVDSEITVGIRDKKYIPTEITARSDLNFNVKNTVITVSKTFQLAEINVPHLDYVDAEINVQQINVDKVFAELTVTRESVFTEITSRQGEDDAVDTEISIRALHANTTDTELTVTRESIFTEITVTEYFDLDTEIFVKYTDDIEIEITATTYDQIPIEIDVVIASYAETVIFVNKPIIKAVITVPFWDDSDVFTEIMPRVLRVSDVNAEIFVRKIGNGAYAFII